jgi:tetratricopeptide (TPR) repeat protein
MQPDDAWNYGTLGDGYLELGQYEQAFAAFDRMMQVRPSAAGYARVAYAWEIKGDRREALKTMTMAAESTTAADPEAQAWQFTQLGHLLLDAGRLDDARREFERALYTYPDYALAAIGLAKLEMVAGSTADARAAFRALFDAKPTPELAMRLGDLDAAAGDHEGAERYYAIVETGWKFDTPEPVLLSRFLSERNRRVDEALALAEEAGKTRQDIFTADALAWALFRKGRVAEAADASQRALRTGTRDRVILTHAAAIQEALGRGDEARRRAALALDGHPRFDPIVAPLAASLQSRLVDDTRTLARNGR